MMSCLGRDVKSVFLQFVNAPISAMIPMIEQIQDRAACFLTAQNQPMTPMVAMTNPY
jgi:hypothetical protein